MYQRQAVAETGLVSDRACVPHGPGFVRTIGLHPRLGQVQQLWTEKLELRRLRMQIAITRGDRSQIVVQLDRLGFVFEPSSHRFPVAKQAFVTDVQWRFGREARKIARKQKVAVVQLEHAHDGGDLLATRLRDVHHVANQWTAARNLAFH